MIRVGVIGYGYWGPNLVRNFVESGRSQVSCVSDLNLQRLSLVNARYPGSRRPPMRSKSSVTRQWAPWPSRLPFPATSS